MAKRYQITRLEPDGSEHPVSKAGSLQKAVSFCSELENKDPKYNEHKDLEHRVYLCIEEM